MLKRICAAALAILTIFTVSASAITMPSGYTTTDSKPKGAVKAVIIEDTVNFYTAAGTLQTLKKGETVTVKGMQDKTYAKVVYGDTKGYVNAKALMSLTGVSAYVSKDCKAYEYGGDKKTKAVWGTKVYMVGRYTDDSGEVWILCANKSGDALAYIKKDNLYR